MRAAGSPARAAYPAPVDGTDPSMARRRTSTQPEGETANLANLCRAIERSHTWRTPLSLTREQAIT